MLLRYVLRTPKSGSAVIISEAMAWPGVHRERGRFGAVVLRVGRRELGHLHGDAVADVPLPRKERDRLVSAGAALEHRWRPDSGWVTVPLTSEEAVHQVLALLRGNYERSVAKSA